MSVKLGDLVRDRITGCRTIAVDPREAKDNAKPDRLWFDEPQLEVMEEAFILPEPGQRTGGPERRVERPRV